MERRRALRSRSTPALKESAEPATRVRTLTAIADSERSGPLGQSASLPQLDVGRRGRRTRLPTPAFERIDLALPPVSLGRSRSLSALTGLANARQQRVQIELDQVVKRQNEGQQPAEPLPSASIAARARTKVNAFDEMFEEIATIYEDAAAIRTPATSAAAAAALKVAAPTAGEAVEAEARRKEEGRLRHAAELQRKMASCGRRVSRARMEVEKKIELLREDDDAWFDFDKYCTSIRVPPGSDVVLLGPNPKCTPGPGPRPRPRPRPMPRPRPR